MGKSKLSKRSAEIVTLFLLKALKREGIDHVFLVPGYLVDFFLPHFKTAGITPIIAAHEGGAAYMADGYARVTNKFGVCMGIGGPGVTNMVSAVASAYGDRSPILIIAGKIDRLEEAKGTFQDSSSSSGIDDITIMRTVTGFAATIPNAKSADIFLRKAIRVIRDVESLPVFLSIPIDIQKENYPGDTYSPLPDRPHRVLDIEQAEYHTSIITKASRIAIFAGNGTVRSDAQKEIEMLAQEFSIPVVTTLRAKGAISEDHPMSFGVFGLGGSLQANKILAGSPDPKIEGPEAILVLGATLNENNTFGGTLPVPQDLILLDINPNANRDIERYHPGFMMGDVKKYLQWLLQQPNYRSSLNRTKPQREKWLEKIRSTKGREDIPDDDTSGIHPGRAVLELRKVADEDKETRNCVLVADSGAHTFFAGHYWKSYAPLEFIVMTTMGPMGYSIGTGIGVKKALEKLGKDSPVVCVVGDGGMLMHGMELQTAVRHNIPLVIVVINNTALGNVYLRFKKNPDLNPGIDLTKLVLHDWKKFAESLGGSGATVTSQKDLASAYRMAFKYTRQQKKPFVVDVICSRDFETPNKDLTAPAGLRSFRGQAPEANQVWFG